ncbi:MAG TPA: family 20 glycosylhydrolase [Chthonomonadaceae bacterium]|nr:family 20 glycosylhydrolase [Chthonomonadaceae bacterium]
MRRIGRVGFLLALLAVALQPLLSDAQGAPIKAEDKRMPKITEAREGAFRCDTAPALLVGKSLADSPAFLPLQERLQSRFQATMAPARPDGQLPGSPFILIGLAQDHPALRQLLADHQAKLPKGGLGPEGYILDITPARVLIAASQPAGAFYGALALLERDTAAEKGLTIPAGTVADWPTMGWRGMHLLVNSRADLPNLETLITEYLPQLRLNQLILEINYHFQYRSHPEITEGDALTRDDCRHLKELADKHFVRLIPMINCLGHQSWAEHTAQLLKSHPEFDETPDYPADNKGIYCRSWCPSHPDINKVVFALIDELVDAFDAKAFHVGMDEVFILGQCPRCKGTENARLFAKAVNDLHGHIVGARKLQMLMWGDRFLDGDATKYGEWEASKNGTAAAIDLVPKDIILCDWHYETSYGGAPATYPSVRLFQDKGFRVWPSGWRTEENVRMLTGCALQNQSDRMVGYLATTWSGAGNIVGGLSGSVPPPQGRENRGDLPAAIRKGAQIAWEGKVGT